MNPKDHNVHEIASYDVLVMLLADRDLYIKARHEMHLQPRHFYNEKQESLAKAIFALHEEQKPLALPSLLALSDGWTEADLSDIRLTASDTNRQSSTRRQAFCDNVKLVVSMGLVKGTKNLLNLAIGQYDSKPVEDRPLITKRLINALMGLPTGSQMTAIRSSEHGKQNREKRSENYMICRSGIPYIDMITHGFEEGHLWWIAGAYKRRKTTLMNNLALALAMQGVAPVILSKEMNQEELQTYLESMLAVGWAYQRHCDGAIAGTHGNYTFTYGDIDSDYMKSMSPARLERLNDGRKQAIEWAWEVYDQLPIRIYDSTPEHGELSDYESVESAIIRDLANEKGKRVFFIDYAQNIKGEGTIYNRMEEMSLNFQNLAKSKKICIVLLAQLNEAGIQAGDDSYSPSTKGGGDAAASANYFFKVKYDADEDEYSLPITLKLSRHSKQGNKTKEDLPIHPATGLITNADWITSVQNTTNMEAF